MVTRITIAMTSHSSHFQCDDDPVMGGWLNTRI